ncbi:MAG: hypothetical protein OHK0023_02820 [Anaerolineae bacterium]
MGRKRRGNFHKKTSPLVSSHARHTPDGYQGIVLGRGLVCFNVPKSWVIAAYTPFTMHDQPQPNDTSRLSASYWQSPLGIDWRLLPVSALLADTIQHIPLPVLTQSEVIPMAREDIEAVWVETRFLDPQALRPAYTRNLMARGRGIHALISLDFWVEDAPKLSAMWEEIQRSLRFGREIVDPTEGEMPQ